MTAVRIHQAHTPRKNNASFNNRYQLPNGRNKKPVITSRPIWFLAMIVTVSVLALMHRFRDIAEPQLILQYQQSPDKEVVTSTEDEIPQQQQQQQRSMLRDTAKKEAFTPDEEVEEQDENDDVKDEESIIEEVEEEDEEAEESEEAEDANEEDMEFVKEGEDAKEEEEVETEEESAETEVVSEEEEVETADEDVENKDDNNSAEPKSGDTSNKEANEEEDNDEEETKPDEKVPEAAEDKDSKEEITTDNNEKEAKDVVEEEEPTEVKNDNAEKPNEAKDDNETKPDKKVEGKDSTEAKKDSEEEPKETAKEEESADDKETIETVEKPDEAKDDAKEAKPDEKESEKADEKDSKKVNGNTEEEPKETVKEEESTEIKDEEETIDNVENSTEADNKEDPKTAAEDDKEDPKTAAEDDKKTVDNNTEPSEANKEKSKEEEKKESKQEEKKESKEAKDDKKDETPEATDEKQSDSEANDKDNANSKDKNAKEEEKDGGKDSTKEKAAASEAPREKKSVKELNERPVYFIGRDQVKDNKDAFSASWLQRTEDFMEMPLDKIGICEDAAFWAFRRRPEKLSMTLDWLDFSLEHLSKWWKILRIFDQQSVFDKGMEKFSNYLGGSAKFPMEESPSFQEAVAVIAFQSYKDGRHKEKAHQLTLMSLGATIESLRRAGMGRVVVVGSPRDLDPEGQDKQVSEDTFRYLKQQVEPRTKGLTNTTDVKMVGNMEVAFVGFETSDSVTKYVKKNVPRAALAGLRNAIEFGNKDKAKRTTNETEFMVQWLGNKHHPHYWKYIYLTEPDSILQTRPSTLKQLKAEVDQGKVLIPHRLQPVPHESDAPGHDKDWLYLPNDFAPIIELDSIGEHDACCDAHKGSDYKPGLPPYIPTCGNFWYMCDFSRKVPKENRTHVRLQQYSLIRLKQGTEIVSLSALEHGRPCIPKKNDVCVPPEQETDQKTS